MIRIAENCLSVKSVDVRVGSAYGYLGTLPTEGGAYTISFSYVVHSGEVRGGFLLYDASQIATIPPSEGRISFTFEWGPSHTGSNLRLYSDSVGAKDNHVTFYDIHIARGTQGADIWTPAHADLTPEQIATLPPYGEYKEIKSF